VGCASNGKGVQKLAKREVGAGCVCDGGGGDAMEATSYIRASCFCETKQNVPFEHGRQGRAISAI
jgi:hypothetical protein